jgi:MraZ protein
VARRGKVIDYFTGEDDLKVDPKGRVTIPHRIRRVVERGDPAWTEGQRPTLFVVYGARNWDRLECYSVKGHNRKVRQIRALPAGHPDRAPLETLYVTYALEIQIDEEGRITIPTKLRDKLGLERDLYLSSKSDHFRLWRNEHYQRAIGDRVDTWSEAKGPDFDIDALLPDLPDLD